VGTLTAGVVRELPRRAHDLSRRTVTISQRGRMLEGITAAVAKLGYAQTTVADVIERAGVSRKTFYEQFRDKEHCFQSAYEALTDDLRARVTAAGDRERVGPKRRRAQLACFLAALAADPVAAQVMLLDVLAGGPRLLRVRHRVGAAFAVALLGESTQPALRTAIMGGITAVVNVELLHGERDAAHLPDRLDELADFVERALGR
jgi:AcrR family transcriptional regulator